MARIKIPATVSPQRLRNIRRGASMVNKLSGRDARRLERAASRVGRRYATAGGTTGQRVGLVALEETADLLARFGGVGGMGGRRKKSRGGGVGLLMLEELAGVLDRYAKGGVVSTILSNFGPLGKAVGWFLGGSGGRPSGVGAGDLQAAIDLLTAFGFKITPPGQDTPIRPGESAATMFPATPVPRPGTVSPAPQTTPPGKQPIPPLPKGSEKHDPGRPFDLKGARAGHTMERVAKSSNVHSFGYDPANSILFVRYFASEVNRSSIKRRKVKGGVRISGKPGKTVSGKSKTKPGPKYAYFNVSESLYHDMRKAISKGVFVWDELRVRKSLWGYKKDYRLVSPGTTVYAGEKGNAGVAYVPRRASEHGYHTRRIGTSAGASFQSALRPTATGMRRD